MKRARLPICGNLIGATGDGGSHRELFCQETATFNYEGEQVCANCAIELRENHGGAFIPIAPEFWADLIDTLTARHHKEAVEYRAAIEEKLKRADQLESERESLIREKCDAESRAFRAEQEVARLRPVAEELARFRNPPAPATGAKLLEVD